MSEKCLHSIKDKCVVLINTACDGLNTGCSFFKTQKEFIEDANAAIITNRLKGNCASCKYRVTKCELRDFTSPCGFGGIE